MLDISLNTNNRKALCIGGGKAATIKLKNLIHSGIECIVLSEKLNDELSKNIFIWRIQWIRENWSTSSRINHFDLHPGDIVLCCTPYQEINQSIQNQCQHLGLLCFRADDPQSGDFQFQAGFETKNFKLNIRHKDFNRKESMRLRDYLKNLLEPVDWPSSKVFICGFGPGDPKLMTIRARQLMLQAEVIFYDDLIDPHILDFVNCEKVYVGKRKGTHYKKQEEINQLLLEASKQGLKTLRLKGGDPFIFGRGGEEVQFLKQHSVVVEVIPGITSSLAASATSVIPLTHRGVSRRLTFMSAHHVDTELEDIPKEGTIVLYMGASKLSFLSFKLQELGLKPETGVCLIYNASKPDEESEFHTIESMGDSQLKSPLAIIIGEVVNHFQPQG